MISLSLKPRHSVPDGKQVSCGVHRMGDSYGAPTPLDTNEERLAITEIILHPDFDPRLPDKDIAVIKVDGSFSCSPDKIYPACLPSSEVRPDPPRQI